MAAKLSTRELIQNRVFFCVGRCLGFHTQHLLDCVISCHWPSKRQMAHDIGIGRNRLNDIVFGRIKCGPAFEKFIAAIGFDPWNS